MPSEALSLALAASIYPPALAAVIALGHGRQVRSRVVLLVVAAYATTFVTGSLMLVLFADLSASTDDVLSPSAGLYIAGGLVAIAFALRLRRRRPARGGVPHAGPSRFDRYLERRWSVLLLGVVLYVIPSPIFIAAVRAITEAHASRATEFVYLAEMLVVMLWLIELPMVMLVAAPERGTRLLESVNGWFRRHGRSLGELALVLLGAYLLTVGIVELV